MAQLIASLRRNLMGPGSNPRTVKNIFEREKYGIRLGNPLLKVALCFRKCSKTIKFQKSYFFAELLPFFYISLRFLCKFEERL